MIRLIAALALFSLVFVGMTVSPAPAQDRRDPSDSKFREAPFAPSSQINFIGAAGTPRFGDTVTVLPNGNIVVTAPDYDIPSGANDVGAVFLFNGVTLAMISRLNGSTAGDLVGNNGVTVLTNGNFVVRSPNWNNPSPVIAEVGAVTWCNATTGCSGAISGANSLIGSTASDLVGIDEMTVLTNGNYVVRSQYWDNPAPATLDVGAVTWGNGTSGTSGLISISNSLIGSTENDLVGVNAITTLTNGNYVVNSPFWDNPAPAIVEVGAVTWGNGTSGTVGLVSISNSLVGATESDSVGNGGVTALMSGNYVVGSPNWDNPAPAILEAGAVTWGNGFGGVRGLVSISNSLIGGTENDRVGIGGITALTNGNYVVSSFAWNNPLSLITNAGAATLGNGASGTAGLVSASNSLIGVKVNDWIGLGGVTALTNGNYVVRSPNWDNPSPAISDVGAVTWGNGASGTVGMVSASNSLIGGTANDYVGNSEVTALTNGNYVVGSPYWDNPSPAILDVGAATWGNGTGGTVGLVSGSNSLIGSTASDYVGIFGLAALTNGNYVVRSRNWDNPAPAIADVGAVTWGNGTGGTVGLVSVSNSLIGGTTGDFVGFSGLTALTNGNYVVSSPNWTNPSPMRTNAGAVTWGDGTTGTVGLVSVSNSLIGSTTDDFVGGFGVTALTNGNYVVNSTRWDNPAVFISDVGAVTWGNGASGTVGLVSVSNSLIGNTADDYVGSSVSALNNGNYVVNSAFWDNQTPIRTDASAYTFGNGAIGTGGPITDGAFGGNSVVGHVTNGTNTFAFDATRNRWFVGHVEQNFVSVLFFDTTAIADGDINNPANWSNGLPNGLVTGIIPSGRSMTISSVMNIGQIQVQCGGNLTGGSSSAYIVGSVRRDFCGAVNESFTYPLGDQNNYSPLTATNVNGSGSLTATVSDNFLIGLPQALSLSRFWSLTGSGITTDLTFNYTNSDVNGTESGYRAFKRSGSTNLTVEATPSSVNAAAKTFTVTGVSQFSDWSAGPAPLAPTAAGVTVAGRVLTSSGLGLRNAVVTITDSQGVIRRAVTSTFGYYRFDDVEVGGTYTVAVQSKRFQFTPQIISLNDAVDALDFTAQ
ncbi:MAG: carboxypeptidase regulatory-like domain-containing protein [Chloracidobacterium sp.]|nr:carboxypeptidase regulatory-like domain-containing protein [Chloracidobacterium sp.]